MREAFDPQLRLDCSPILHVELNLKCRDEMVPVLQALKHIYSRADLRDEILQLIEKDVNGRCDRHRGREGMAYWEILVLAAVRLGCGLDYDKLQDLAENHRNLRHIMGIGDWEHKTFGWRRIQDNLTMISTETLERIHQLIVSAGHELVPDAVENMRADSFVVETNVHYPTEGSLIRDGLCKIISLCFSLAMMLNQDGWRQHEHLKKKAKKLARKIDRIAARKGKNCQERLQAAYQVLLRFADDILSRARELEKLAKQQGPAHLQALALAQQIQVFLQRTEHVCSTARRRVIDGEQVPNNEKLFSIFEPHTQLYRRGKAGEPNQFGRLVLIYEDAAGFICHCHLLDREAQDRDVVVEQTRIVQTRMQGRIQHLSFDHGFHSPEIQEALADIVAHPCLPIPGKKGKEQQTSVEFRQARQRHPGVESAVGALQSGNDLKRCRDRTENGFERYIALGILGRNLHVLGKLLIAQKNPNCQAAHSQRGKRAA